MADVGVGGGGDGWKTNTTLFVRLGVFCLSSYVCPPLFYSRLSESFEVDGQSRDILFKKCHP